MKRFFEQKFFASAFILTLLMAALECPLWISLFAFPLLLWKWGVEKHSWRPLPSKMAGFLAVLLAAQVYFQYHTLLGQEASNTFLIGLAALRVMEYRNERDHRFIVLLGFILVSLKALFTLDFYWAIPSLYSVIGFWYSLLKNDLPEKKTILIRAFSLSLPLTLMSFFAFPRLVLPWTHNQPTTSTQVGFSEQLNPGDVAALAQTNAMAFRARFEEAANTRNLYWRGAVLKVSQGMRWLPSRLGFNSPKKIDIENATGYEVALEPTSRNFLFVLDNTVHVESEGIPILNLNHTIYRSAMPLHRPISYRGFVVSKTQDDEVPDKSFLKIPRLSGRVQSWVEQTKAKSPKEEDRIKALENFFSDPRFVYTLSPGSYSQNELEEFLFERRRGFCEHFSGSYATLARALGIPSRVVVGYHGGIYNPVGTFWRVNQRDAHAWVEIFNKGQWRRVDPTSWVAPLRLTLGSEVFFNLSESDQQIFARDVDWRPQGASGISWWEEFIFHFEDLNYRWTYFLMEFDKQYQQEFWGELAANWGWVALGLALSGLLAMTLAKVLFRRNSARNETEKLMEEILRFGKRRKIPREKAEPPLPYILRLKERFPEIANLANNSFEVYDLVMYQMKETNEDISNLKKCWRKL